MSDSSAKPKLVTTPSSEVVEKPKRRRLTTAYNAWCEIATAEDLDNKVCKGEWFATQHHV